ncbi:MAG TPA: DUF202 domain-containing protein [Solirubrobacterales bacterium]|nr:DUF202 domain-containing protein [Solirubrobacterales bacterium]
MSEVDPTDPDGVDRRTALADQRTSLAGERTLLAWWRTGLTAIAVALGVGRVLPELAPHATRWPYVVLGVGFALYGTAMLVLGSRRMGIFDREVWATSDRPAEGRFLVAFMGAGAILGVGALAMIISQ